MFPAVFCEFCAIADQIVFLQFVTLRGRFLPVMYEGHVGNVLKSNIAKVGAERDNWNRCPTCHAADGWIPRCCRHIPIPAATKPFFVFNIKVVFPGDLFSTRQQLFS